MRTRVPYWIGFSAAVAAFAFTACQRATPPAPPTPPPPRTLTILTPHDETIRATFELGFWYWYLDRKGRPVEIEWIYRGSPQCVEYARAARSTATSEPRDASADLVFGGGLTDHGVLAAEGLSRPVDLKDVVADIPADVHGLATRDPQGRWYATGLSSFGIVYNERACHERGIAPPQTWADLAAPRFFGWVAVADPQASGSHRECLVLILDHLGWADGWRTIVGLLGNARALNARSGDALRQVQAGTSLATLAVSFDGMRIAAESGGAVRYIDPPGATAATPDLISVLTTSRDVELATDFVRFVLSEEGQELWGVAREHRAPHGETLYHYPIRPSIYARPAEQLAVAHNALEQPFGMTLAPARATELARLLVPLVRAACGEGNHVRLQRAWQQSLAAGRSAESAAQLATLPFDPADAPALAAQLAQPDSEEARQILARWTAALRELFTSSAAPAGS